MDAQTLDATYGRTVVIDICHACTGIWFDSLESLRLTPGAVLRVFKLIDDRRGERAPAPEVTRCPRCRARLLETTNMQRATRFSYLRCPADHGHFITFFEFLREKNFVRPLSGAELAQLKKAIRVVHCGSCGAPVDLERAAACGYCRTPISMLDPGQIERAVHTLQEAERRRTTVDPQWPARLLIDRLVTERALSDPHAGVGPLRLGLVDAGVHAITQALGHLSD
jgi:Zn-finger nucleic acid-binding protein